MKILRHAINKALYRLLLTMAEILTAKFEVHGVRVFIPSNGTLDDEGRARDVAAKITAAMELIAAVDHRRHARLLSDVRRILLIPVGGPEYRPPIRAIIMGVNWVSANPVEKLAMAIVHEACHARIGTRGIRTVHANLSRIEHRCVAEEIAFARRLPGAQELVSSAIAALGTKWWEPERAEARRDRDMRAMGASETFVRFGRWLRRH